MSVEVLHIITRSSKEYHEQIHKPQALTRRQIESYLTASLQLYQKYLRSIVVWIAKVSLVAKGLVDNLEFW